MGVVSNTLKVHNRFCCRILYWLRISRIDPSSDDFQKAFIAAANGESLSEVQKKSGGTSGWPIIAFLSFIFTAPFLMTRLMGSVHKAALDECEYCILISDFFVYFIVFEIRFLLPETYGLSHGLNSIWLLARMLFIFTLQINERSLFMAMFFFFISQGFQ